MLLDRGEGAAEAYVDTGRSGRVCQDPREHRPHDRAAARHVRAGDARRWQCGNDRPVRQSKFDVVGRAALLEERLRGCPSWPKARSVAPPRLMPAP